MSSKRTMKRSIPKNSDWCRNCKNRIIVGKKCGYEEDTNAYYVIDNIYKCKLLNIVGSDEDVYEFSVNNEVMLSQFSEDELMEIFDRITTEYEFHNGRKVCGYYKYKPKNNGHWKKHKDYRIEYNIDIDDIPF